MTWIEELKQEIKERGDGSGFEYDFARIIAREFPVTADDVDSIVREEAEYLEKKVEIYKNRRNRWGLCIQDACERILIWLTDKKIPMWTPDKFGSRPWSELAKFVRVHRKAAVWAAFVHEAKKAEKRKEKRKNYVRPTKIQQA